MDQPDRQSRPYALKTGEGWTYRFGIDFIVKRGEVQKGSGTAFLEYVTRKGEEPSSHTHETEDEMFYVLEGAITFRCGMETFDLEQEISSFCRVALSMVTPYAAKIQFGL